MEMRVDRVSGMPEWFASGELADAVSLLLLLLLRKTLALSLTTLLYPCIPLKAAFGW